MVRVFVFLDRGGWFLISLFELGAVVYLRTLRAAHERWEGRLVNDSIYQAWTHSVCFAIHSSSANSRAELRASGSHWSILRMKSRNNSLSALSSSRRRDVSRSSSVLGQGMGTPAEKTPLGKSPISLKTRHLQLTSLQTALKALTTYLPQRKICFLDAPGRVDWEEEARGVQSSRRDGPFPDMRRVLDRGR